MPASGRILKDEIVSLKGPKGQTKKLQGWTLRRIEAWVEVDGKARVIVYIINNVKWAAGSVCDLCKARWEIEVFFKQVKQPLRLSGFLGYSANAVRWQVWTALLVYVLLRLAAHLSQWGHSSTRLFAVVRAALWERLDAPGCCEAMGQRVARSSYGEAPKARGSRDWLRQHPVSNGPAPAPAIGHPARKLNLTLPGISPPHRANHPL